MPVRDRGMSAAAIERRQGGGTQREDHHYPQPVDARRAPELALREDQTDEGIVGCGEASLEWRERSRRRRGQRARAAADRRGPDPIEHHWQRMHRHGFWRGGVILISAISAIDQALWDIKGKTARRAGLRAARRADSPPGASVHSLRRAYPRSSRRARPRTDGDGDPGVQVRDGAGWLERRWTSERWSVSGPPNGACARGRRPGTWT